MAAVALMMIIIQILCAYIPTTALIMISADFDEGKISLAGSMDEVGTECAYILRQILEQNQNNWGALGAQGVLVNIFMIALTMDPEKRKQVNIQWKSKNDMFKQEEKSQLGEVDLALVSQLHDKAIKEGLLKESES